MSGGAKGILKSLNMALGLFETKSGILNGKFKSKVQKEI